jgi:hypothetical protein
VLNFRDQGATRFELATFSLATVPDGFRHVELELLGMPLKRALHTFYAVSGFRHLGSG